MARPIITAAMSPVSSRSTSQSAATPITAASCAVVPSTSPRRSIRNSPHSRAAPATPPATPMPTLARKSAATVPGRWWMTAVTAWKTELPECLRPGR
ncbi:hypothetical protein SHIRM173S_06158 [Streptomyces hirsutus]